MSIILCKGLLRLKGGDSISDFSEQWIEKTKVVIIDESRGLFL